MSDNLTERTEFLLYQTDDDRIRIETRMQDETVWLTQKQMAELFQKDIRTINEHLKNIYTEGELGSESTIRKFRIVRLEGTREVTRSIDHYNLDAIISVGYRVNSIRGTQFRIWATQRLREYLIKGFVLDDDRLKRGGGGNYFDELLARIRDIRSSEKVFWRKVLDIYATSINYDPQNDLSQEFFAEVQNKMHWAAHSHTAAEIIHHRVDADKENMGLTNWVGSQIRKSEVSVAKNYLNQDELDLLNRIVTAYLEFAELQALNRRPMYMKDWIRQLDMFLTLSGRELLDHAGKISHEQALKKAQIEYEKYRQKQLEQPTMVEKHFIEAEKEIKQIASKIEKKEDRKK